MGLCQSVFAQAFPLAEQDRAQAICEAESGGDPHAWKDDAIEDSRGLGQINVRAWPQFAVWDLFDPATNARAARIVRDAQGWEAWSTYTNGRYRQFLDGSAPSGLMDVGSDQGRAVLVVVGLLAALYLLS